MRHRSIIRHFIVIACMATAVSVTPACSQSSSPEGAAKATSASNPLGDSYKGPPTPCDHELSVKDAADLINVPVSINHYSMTASRAGEGCELGAGSDFSSFIDISIKKSDRQTYMNRLQLNATHTPLAGIGEEAVSFATTDSNVPNAKEMGILARKGDWLCEAELIHKNGAAGDHVLVSANDTDNAKKLGALCNTLFAAKR